MIVQCEQCSTRFRLDDSRVKDHGVKVRCSKCKYIFMVFPENTSEEADFDSILSGLGDEKTGMTETAVVPGDMTSPDQDTSLTVPDFDNVAEESKLIPPEEENSDLSSIAGTFPTDSGLDEFVESASDDRSIQNEKDFLPAGEHEFDFSSFSGVEDNDEVSTQIEESVLSGDTSLHGDSFSLEVNQFEQNESVDKFDAEGLTLDFTSELDQTGTAPEQETVSDTELYSHVDNLDLEAISETGLSDAADEQRILPAKEASGASETPQVNMQDAHVSGEKDEFDFGSIDFGTVVAASELDKEPEPQKGPVIGGDVVGGETDEKVTTVPDFKTEFQVKDDELPPLNIPSRRKGNSLFPMVVTAISLLFVVGLAAVGFYLLKEGPSGFNRFGFGEFAKWFGIQHVEDGSISIKNSSAMFLQNKDAGELFVINGEAVNNFKKPRASIQIKSMLYGKNGAILKQKTVYCGNSLTKEQLVTLPLAKIEAAMNNQFGDSLSNLGVQPGKSIPFVVVFSQVPKDGKEFGLEVVGSTVASQ